ncbi:MAG: YggS family pyridoxal phosphate-dependent enzyme, partial [Proteobacteria bacterium]
MESLSDRYQSITTRIQNRARLCGRDPSEITLIAVTKMHPFETIEALYQLGQRDFGENYVQELISKSRQAREKGYADIRWHFIGHLQSNKVKVLLPEVYAIHSVDSVKLASEVSKKAERPVPIFLEINIDEEESKTGAKPGELLALLRGVRALPQLELQGLMCIPSPEDPKKLRLSFRKVRELGAQMIGARCHNSMGMSDDFEIA